MGSRIVLCFSDEPTAPSRLNPGDILLVARKDDAGEIKIVQELQYIYKNTQGSPVIASAIYESLDEYIHEALQKGTLNVEILAHSASISAHYISPTETKNYPSQWFAIDELTTWLESNILKKNLPKISISLIVCRAGAETKEFPAIAEQMFALFTEKPQKITARKGFVYVSNKEKIYSLSAFDMLLHKAFINQDTSPETILEQLSFPALRGLRTLLSITQLHTYDDSTPLNEKFVYFKNDEDKTLKIDKHLYDLYHLSHPQPNKKLEQCTKEEFIKLANIGIQSDKNEKLYKKAQVVLHDSDSIYPAVVRQIDLKNYQKKDILFKRIDDVYATIENTPQLKHAKKFMVFLNIIEAYVNERYVLNLPMENIESLLAVLEGLIAKKGQFNERDYQEIKEISQHIQSHQNIKYDVSEHMDLAGLQLPTYETNVLNHCTQMNELFAKYLESFSKIIKIENQMAENAQIYTMKVDVNIAAVEHPQEEMKVDTNTAVLEPPQEENNKQIFADIEKLRQVIHQQIQEAAYLFSFNKFTSKQSQVLTSMLQLIHVRQKQEIKNTEPDAFAPLLLQNIKQLEAIEPSHARAKFIKRAVEDFVNKHYHAPEPVRSQQEMKSELVAHKEATAQERRLNDDDYSSLFELD